MSGRSQESDERPDGLLVVAPGEGEGLLGANLICRAAWTEGHACVFDQEAEPARMLEITTPGERMQSFQQELRDLHAGGGDADQLVALAAAYGTELAPAVTAELSARHGVSAGQGYAPVGNRRTPAPGPGGRR